MGDFIAGDPIFLPPTLSLTATATGINDTGGEMDTTFVDMIVGWLKALCNGSHGFYSIG